jgi:hypothetical protein
MPPLPPARLRGNSQKYSQVSRTDRSPQSLSRVAKKKTAMFTGSRTNGAVAIVPCWFNIGDAGSNASWTNAPRGVVRSASPALRIIVDMSCRGERRRSWDRARDAFDQSLVFDAGASSSTRSPVARSSASNFIIITRLNICLAVSDLSSSDAASSGCASSVRFMPIICAPQSQPRLFIPHHTPNTES